MLTRIAQLVTAAPKRVLAVVFLVLVGAGIYGASASQYLLSGGYEDPHSEAATAAQVVDETFDRGGLQIVFKLDAPPGTDMATDPVGMRTGREIIAELEANPNVQRPILSVWQQPALASSLLSEDRTSALIVATLSGGDNDAPRHAEELEGQIVGERNGITIRAGGQALVFQQVNEQTSRDLAIAEGIAIPISFLVLIVVFGGVVAAALPIAVGVFAIVVTFAVLRLIGSVTDVSIFALNLTTAMGLALAIDYTLLLVTRYREELASGRERRQAILVMMNTAGRTVAFSAVTVALSLSALAIFPMYFLRSFAYAGLGVVIVAVLAALVVTPALLMVLGPRIDALDVRRAIRRVRGRPEPASLPIEESGWYRFVQWVLRHAAPVGAGVIIVLLVLGAPFLSIRFGFPDDRVLPSSASAHEVQQEIRDGFTDDLSGTLTGVVVGPADPAARAEYAAALSRVDGVTSVSGASGTFVDGAARGPADPAGTHTAGDGTVTGLLSISTEVEPLSDAGSDQLDTLRAVPTPPGLAASFTGLAALNADTVDSIYAHLPWVLAVIAIATFILLFLFTGSVVLPLKALVLNVLSLSATFGAMVWFFQEGHLGGLGTTATGYLVATMPVLMFCIAFGLSMDYEVFLLGRVREEWLASDRSRAANDHAVAVGLARTGRVVTAAALLMSIVFAGIAASQVSFMRMFGVGLTLAVLMDATVIRMLLVPAFMRLAGRANWWAPAPLRALHDRIGLSEEGDHGLPAGTGTTGTAATGTTATGTTATTTKTEKQESSEHDVETPDAVPPRLG
ncbi:MMPL family transporter [Gordonia sp. NB41Y]|uniref:MMPL family transporter n=1 Tax=Gordonia sp. NB41Y TaxID=875808 RepID=UPI0006B18AEB|nr:MMPL family transporter [Gordonia sp. NB41Y]EMP13179.2 membrane protein [Gordonia sp. NB41Y]WLP91700.1 MMPL family transporter [Gordonia sp. NB41Y]